VFDRWSADAAGVRALAGRDNVITMFDVIGEDFWSGGGVTAKKVAAQLRAIGDRPSRCRSTPPAATCSRASRSTTCCASTPSRSPSR
jgi:ATP-dependent Clp protease protease subunit